MAENCKWMVRCTLPFYVSFQGSLLLILQLFSPSDSVTGSPISSLYRPVAGVVGGGGGRVRGRKTTPLSLNYPKKVQFCTLALGQSPQSTKKPPLQNSWLRACCNVHESIYSTGAMSRGVLLGGLSRMISDAVAGRDVISMVRLCFLLYW